MSSDDVGAISEAYKAYKLSTNYVLIWLQSQYQLQVLGNASSFTSTNDILTAVRVLREKKIGVPSSVISSLRNAITKRQEVAAIYQGLGTNDLAHENFLRRLRDILSILNPLTTASATSQADPLQQDSFVTPNPFSSLKLVADESDNEPYFPTPCAPPELPPAIQSQSKPQTSPKRSKELGFVIEDDRLEYLVQVIMFIYQYDALQSQLREYWADAARGSMPLPLAATLTGMTFNSFINCMMSFHANDSPKLYVIWEDAHRLHTMHPKFAAGLTNRDGPISGPARFGTLAQTFHNFKFFRQSMNEKKAREFRRTAGIVQLLPYRRPQARISAVKPDKSERTYIEKLSVVNVLMTIESMIADKTRTSKSKDFLSPYSYRLDTRTPIQLAAEEFLKGESLSPKSDLVMGMDLFLSTYEGFLWADERLNVQSCRKLVIQLSRDMQVGILPVIAAVKAIPQQSRGGWEDTTINDSEQFHEDLYAYQRQEIPDLYHQAPWTAGHHIAEMLARAHLIGNRIVCEWNIVPSVLHMYNALCRSHFNLPRIGLLEELCELFTEALFLSSRPDRNFVSHYRQSIFETSISNGTVQISWKKTGGPFRKRHVHSSQIDLHLNRYFISPTVLCKLHDLPFRVDPSYALREKISMASKISARNVIEKAKNKLLPEFQGPKPVARVNYFSIFALCDRILRDFCRLIQPSTYRDIRNEYVDVKCPMLIGATLADTVLQTIVREPEILETGLSLQGHQLLQAAAEAFESVDKTATLQQFLWKV